MKRILALCSIFLGVTGYAQTQSFELDCVIGHQVCPASRAPCTTLLVENNTDHEINVTGNLNATLSGLAAKYDGNFEVNYTFVPGVTSCYIRTGKIMRHTKWVDVMLKAGNGACSRNLPRKALFSSNEYRVMLAENSCVISQ